MFFETAVVYPDNARFTDLEGTQVYQGWLLEGKKQRA